MQWGALHNLFPKAQKSEKQNFGFSTPLPPPNLEDLQEFKQGLVKIVENIEFTNHSNQLQEKMKKDIEGIKSSDKIFLGAE